MTQMRTEEETKELKLLHAEIVAEIVIVKTAHQELGVAISDLRGQLDTLFERMNVEVPIKEYSYIGFKTTEIK
tara:strand:+ start:211 stop:429 length:219 start_codon:yes stop_codon:yes gene_type:complete